MSSQRPISSRWEFAVIMVVLFVTAALGSLPLLMLVASLLVLARARSRQARRGALVAAWSTATAFAWLLLVRLLGLDSSFFYVAPVLAGAVAVLGRPRRRGPNGSRRARLVFSRSPGEHADGSQEVPPAAAS